MKLSVLKEKDYSTTKWQGGETKQLLIWPKGSDLVRRDFLFRISSATFTGKESDFSDFSGFQRFILPLEGKLELSHKKLYSRTLERFEPEYFGGSWKTHARNSLDCRDYNFIIKDGNRALLQVLQNDDRYCYGSHSIITVYSHSGCMISFENGETVSLSASSLLVCETTANGDIHVTKASQPVIITEFCLEIP